jgi:GNAT superfamily N-acetyltransferase
MIRRCTDADFGMILAIINDAASAYKGVIPADRWHEPYMTAEYLRNEIGSGVEFWGYTSAGTLDGVMGIQDVKDVTLIRHAYVRTSRRRAGIGSLLFDHLRARTTRPVLVGTWTAATWAVTFYEKQGFTRVGHAEKTCLLNTYWSIPARQVETSVVLADRTWFQSQDAAVAPP